jgi:hypothetical protein
MNSRIQFQSEDNKEERAAKGFNPLRMLGL